MNSNLKEIKKRSYYRVNHMDQKDKIKGEHNSYRKREDTNENEEEIKRTIR